MTEFESYRVFIEGVCKAYGIDGAIAPLQEGVKVLEEAHKDRTTGGNESSSDSICESASGNSKRKLLNKVYAVANPLTGHLYRDDNWAGVYALIDAIRQNVPEFDFEVGCSDGGYSNPGEDGMPRRKTYSITGQTPEGYPIVGQLHCDAAGTMENPFGAYDMTLILN